MELLFIMLGFLTKSGRLLNGWQKKENCAFYAQRQRLLKESTFRFPPFSLLRASSRRDISQRRCLHATFGIWQVAPGE